MFLALGVILVVIWSRGIDPSSPRDWLLVGLLVVTAIGGLLGAAIIPRSRHYSISGGVLEYRRWGGILRGYLLLSKVEAVRREGRDPTSSNVVFLAEGRQLLLIPEDFLASPEEFLEALRSLALKELPPRFRHANPTHSPRQSGTG